MNIGTKVTIKELRSPVNPSRIIARNIPAMIVGKDTDANGSTFYYVRYELKGKSATRAKSAAELTVN